MTFKSNCQEQFRRWNKAIEKLQLKLKYAFLLLLFANFYDIIEYNLLYMRSLLTMAVVL